MPKVNRSVMFATSLLLCLGLLGCPRMFQRVVATLAWVKQAGGTGSDRAYALDSWADGTSIVAGYFSNQATFGPGETHETVWTSAGDKDIFVAKYNPDGTLEWASAAGGTGADWGLGVAALTDGGCVVTGFFSGEATFGEGEAEETVLTSQGGKDIFVARYAEDGTLVWVVSAGSAGDDEGSAVALLTDGGYGVTGYYSGAANFHATDDAKALNLPQAGGAEDLFVAKYDADGKLLWVEGAGGSGSDKGLGIAAADSGTFFITGYCTGSVNLAPGIGVTGYAGTDFLMAKYDGDGNPVWARNAGSPGDDQGLGIAALPDGGCVATGFFTGTAQLICPCGAEETVVSAGSTDILVVSFNGNGDFSWIARAGGETADKGYAVSANDQGYIAVTGSFTGDAQFDLEYRVLGSQRPVELTSAGEDDIFLVQLAPDGSQDYAIRDGGTAIDFGLAVSMLAGGQDCLVAGRFRETATFGEGDQATTLTAPGNGPCDVFVARYDAARAGLNLPPILGGGK